MAEKHDSYLHSPFYIPFQYLLPANFVQEVAFEMANYTVWYDEFTLKGIQFTFVNENGEAIATEVFGYTEDVNGTAKTNKTVTVAQPIMSV